jgi:hypothetical protein
MLTGWGPERKYRGCVRSFDVTHTRHSYLILSKSNPNFGADFVPLIFTGISVPAPCFAKIGSTAVNNHDFHHVLTICESFALVLTVPSN